MRRIFQISVLCLAAGVVAACEPEMVVRNDPLPYGGVRFIHAVPDMGAVDFRFVDIVENSAQWNIAFRGNPVTASCVTGSASILYKGAQAGERQFRIFMNGTDPAVASTVLHEGTVSVEAGKNYTVMMWGYADPSGTGRPPGAQPRRVDIFEEDVQVPAGQVALRVINASPAAIDASFYPTTGSAPGTSIASGVAPLSRSPYVTSAPGLIRYNIRPAGVATMSLADGQTIPGLAEVIGPPGPIDAAPGTNIAGSAVTAIFYPAPVAGTGAPTTGTAFVISTGALTTLRATATGYARTGGNFINDCFFVGQQITVSGFTNPENNGTSIITAMTSTSLTVNKTGGTVVEAGTTGSTTLAATTTGYVRTTGSFITDGFTVGQNVTASGFTNDENNGASEVTGVTALVLTVDKTGMIAEAAAAGRTIANADPRTLLGARLWSSVWDRRPPRSPGI